MTRSHSFFSLGFAAIVALGATGCNKEKPTPETTTSIPETLQAAPPDVPGDPAGPSGVAFCDAYMTLSEKCVAEKVPEADRAGINSFIRTMRGNYKRLAAAPDGQKQALEQCKRDLENSKTAMGKFGCNWDVEAAAEAAAAAPADSAAAAAPAGSVPVASGDAGDAAATDAGSAKKAGKRKAPASK
ncbi:MAG TPA: hypothetical protein VI072_34140 [Polyangiaceae bacterium]